ncbi:MAG: hypothetical protein JXQ87_13620 [Bacteroidia bacterium]
MDRRQFLKQGTFAILAVSAAPYAQGLSINSGSTLNIASSSHIRHGLLHQLDFSLFNKWPIVFQINEFKEGLNQNSDETDLKLLSLLRKVSNSIESIQMTYDGQQAHFLSEEGEHKISIGDNESKSFIVDGLDVTLSNFQSKGRFKAEFTSNTMLMCYQGSAKMNSQKFNDNTGISLSSNCKELEIIENNTLVVGVNLT